MNKTILYTFFFLLALPVVIFAKDFSGTYSSSDTDIVIILELSQEQKNDVEGSMTFDGSRYSLKGQIQGEKVIGALADDGEIIQFTAKFKQQDLILTLRDSGETETILFTRLNPDGAVDKPETGAISRGEKVIINNNELSETQIDELETIYGFKPLPGKYWYDSVSGLYGVKGFGAYGFMYAGHNFGDLDHNASNGNSRVFVNGRQLPQIELLIWNQLMGYVIEPGRYWLDSNGNAGYEGDPTPIENLYIAAQRNTFSGGGNENNIWSSRFSAGNYDQGNQRGYVSVPGHGPVGYGF